MVILSQGLFFPPKNEAPIYFRKQKPQMVPTDFRATSTTLEKYPMSQLHFRDILAGGFLHNMFFVQQKIRFRLGAIGYVTLWRFFSIVP